MSHRSGSSSGHDTMPTSSVPFSDITVMFSPEPWKIGPERVHRLDLAAQEVQRHLRAGHVGDDEVVHRPGAAEPAAA